MTKHKVKNKHFSDSYSNQSGQTMPYVAILLLLLVAGAFVVYDMGRLVNARIQYQNAADAAALAAVTIKANKHHVDTLMRAAMTQDAIASQAALRASQAVVLQAVAKGSGGPGQVMTMAPEGDPPASPVPPPWVGDLSKRYKAHANLAYKHAVKLHRERLALDAYYEWLNKNAPTAVREAARLGFLANIQGYDDLNDSHLVDNVENILAQNNDLEEHTGSQGTRIGGIPYADEAVGINGTYGKSFVEFKASGISTKSGAALLKYFDRFELTTSSAAQLIRQDKQNPMGIGSLLKMNWYSPRLMAIEKTPEKVDH